MTIAGTMGEVIALEREIMAALSSAAGEAAADAQGVLFNVWCGPCSRLERLRQVAIKLREAAR